MRVAKEAQSLQASLAGRVSGQARLLTQQGIQALRVHGLIRSGGDPRVDLATETALAQLIEQPKSE